MIDVRRSTETDKSRSTIGLRHPIDTELRAWLVLVVQFRCVRAVSLNH